MKRSKNKVFVFYNFSYFIRQEGGATGFLKSKSCVLANQMTFSIFLSTLSSNVTEMSARLWPAWVKCDPVVLSITLVM